VSAACHLLTALLVTPAWLADSLRCDRALRVLHVYVELVLDDESGAEAARRYPGVAAHLLSCGPCAEDYQGLLLAARANPA